MNNKFNKRAIAKCLMSTFVGGHYRVGTDRVRWGSPDAHPKYENWAVICDRHKGFLAPTSGVGPGVGSRNSAFVGEIVCPIAYCKAIGTTVFCNFLSHFRPWRASVQPIYR